MSSTQITTVFENATTAPKNDVALSETTQLYFAIYLIILLIIGVVGNLMTIAIILINKHLRTIPNAYITNLAIADTVLLGVNLPTTILEFLTQRGEKTGYDYCTYTSAINILTMICALTSVGAVGLNRYLHLCLSKDVYKKYTSRPWIAASIFLIWFWSFCITLPPYFGYGTFGYHEKFHTCFFPAFDELSWMYGTIFCCVLGVFPPVLASSFFYGKILLMLRRNHRNLMRHYSKKTKKIETIMEKEKTSHATGKLSDDPVSLDSHKNIIQKLSKGRLGTNNNEHTEEISTDSVSVNVDKRSMPKTKKKPPTSQKQKLIQRNRRQQRSNFMLITIFAIILACWMPISLSFMIDKQNKLPSIVYTLFVILAWTNSSINVFIYAYMNLQFRAAYKKLLKCSIPGRGNSTIPPGESNTDTGTQRLNVSQTS